MEGHSIHDNISEPITQLQCVSNCRVSPLYQPINIRQTTGFITTHCQCKMRANKWDMQTYNYSFTYCDISQVQENFINRIIIMFLCIQVITYPAMNLMVGTVCGFVDSSRISVASHEHYASQIARKLNICYAICSGYQQRNIKMLHSWPVVMGIHR